mgnify:CR=1 FL=1
MPSPSRDRAFPLPSFYHREDCECDLLSESRDQRIGELGAARRRLIGARQITNIARQAFASGVNFGDRATNTGRSFELAEMVEHHRGREDLRRGVRLVLPRDIGSRAMNRLEHGIFFADIRTRGDAQAAEQLAVTDEVLGSLDCADIPQLVVYNKCDTANTVAFDPDILLTSAKTGYGLPALLAKLDEVLNHRVRTIEIVLPYDKLALADILRSRGSVAAEEYREDGVYYRGTVKIDDLHRFEEFLV